MKRFLFSPIGLFLVLGVIGGGAAIVSGILVWFGWMAQVPRFWEGYISRYLRERSPWLGWGPPVLSCGKVSEMRPRTNPLSIGSTPPCINVFGDPFTYGWGLADTETCPHCLSQAREYPAANYGVAGYGSDQALTLLRSPEHLDSAGVVILGHLSANILQNASASGLRHTLDLCSNSSCQRSFQEFRRETPLCARI